MVSVRFYEEEIRTLAGLPDEERGRIITAILLDSIGEPLPELAPMEQAVYNLIRGQVRRDKELSEKRQKSVSSRWEKDSEPEPQVQKNTNAIQNDTSVIQNDTNVIQKNTNVIQNYTNAYKPDTNSYTSTKTKTKTNTNTRTKTKTSTNNYSPAPVNPPLSGLTGGSFVEYDGEIPISEETCRKNLENAQQVGAILERVLATGNFAAGYQSDPAEDTRSVEYMRNKVVQKYKKDSS
ncbi:MAG: hypothetical protein J1F09_09430 [Oscillospiraceae bacterium]|nr:hypothetical protein [Oscillospiraceae bacterium]